MDRPAPPLSYDTAAGRPRWWVRRTLLLLSIAIAVGFGSVWIGPLWRQANLLYWQHRCMTHRPTGQAFPSDWVRYSQLASPPGIKSQGTLFVGELTSPAGHRRLVAVTFQGIGPSDLQQTIAADTWVITPGSLPLTAPQLKTGHRRVPVALSIHSVPFDTGVVDPVNPSHFWIEVRPPGAFIDGWLMDDNTLQLEQR